MTTPFRRTLAHGAWIVSAALVVAAIALLPMAGPIVAAEIVAGAGFIVATLSFSVVGSVIALRQQSHPIGWMFCAVGLCFALNMALDTYARITPTLLGNEWAALGTLLTSFPPFVLVILVLLVFPDGHYLSPRWRWIGRLAIVSGAVLLLGTALTPGKFADFNIENPAGVDWVEGSMLEEGGVGWFGVLVSFVAGGASLLVRFRRSGGERRAQLKWIALAAAGLGFGWFLMSVFWTDYEAGKAVDATFMGQAASAVFILSLAGFPIATAIAVLRYRLYDIDVVINRTLVYGLLTGLLAAMYFAIVAGASTFAPDSNLAVAAATLVVAGLFQPLRKRIQSFIDRRFYRSKYDAVRTIDAFASKLRDEIDLQTLQQELVGVVGETMHPRSVTLWLRDGMTFGGTV